MNSRARINPWRISFSIVLSSALAAVSACSPNQTTGIDSGNAEMVSQGARLYREHCAQCHGVDLQGQADWRKRKPDGKLPAPPHDETGHTWHHPDQVLFEITKHGMVPPHAPANYPSDMPAWGGVLSDRQIWSILSYIQSTWPATALKAQEEIDADYRRMNP